MAFWERSGAPSRPPVHLHNIATCHMETGITDLCLSLVTRRPPHPLSYPNFVSFPLFPCFPSRLSLVVALFLLSCHVSCCVKKTGSCFFCRHGGNYHCRELETTFPTHARTHTHNRSQHSQEPRGCCGGPGAACQHQL